MTAYVNLRDGENVSEQLIQRIMALYPQIPFVSPSGLGTGYTPGSIGQRNGASGADPNHFAIIANGANMTLTARPGWCIAQKDSGSASFDPRSIIVGNTSTMTAVVTNNATGSTRNDTVCLRIDQSTAPNADGSNLLTLFIVAGASGGGLSNAPADGALYVPLANVAVANGAASIAQGNVTDKRYDRRIQAQMYWHLPVANTGGVAIPYDTLGSLGDPNGIVTLGTGAKFTIPCPGMYTITGTIAWSTNTAAEILQFNKNGALLFYGSEAAAAAPQRSAGSDSRKLAAGDTIQGTPIATASLAGDGSGADNWLSIAWEGPA